MTGWGKNGSVRDGERGGSGMEEGAGDVKVDGEEGEDVEDAEVAEDTDGDGNLDVGLEIVSAGKGIEEGSVVDGIACSAVDRVNTSPAPSQSEAVKIGVCTCTNSFSYPLYELIFTPPLP